MDKFASSSRAQSMQSTVSVLIPTYNRARYIRECLESILAQTVKPSQIIVIDDGSTDSTPQVLRAFGHEITYLRKDNGGKSAALNYGLPFVTGEYVWIFDDDDVALPDSIERRLKPLLERGDIDFVYSGHYIGADGVDGKIVRDLLYQPPVVDGRSLSIALMEGCFFTQPGVLARRRCYDRLGPFDETFARGQDYEMLIRMAKQCRGAGLADPTYVVRRHEGVRGPRTMLHASADREKVWLGFENTIGQRIREELALEDYLPVQLSGLADWRQRRLAYLQRMLIMASKGLPLEMATDLCDAVALYPEDKLDEQSATFCRRAMAHGYMQIALGSCSDHFLELIQPLRISKAGRDALKSLARGMFWVARQKGPLHIGRGRALWLCARLFWFSLPTAGARHN